jgi:hypothetical protein
LALAHGNTPEAAFAHDAYRQLLQPPAACDECPSDY